jgi:hypothetical protein
MPALTRLVRCPPHATTRPDPMPEPVRTDPQLFPADHVRLWADHVRRVCEWDEQRKARPVLLAGLLADMRAAAANPSPGWGIPQVDCPPARLAYPEDYPLSGSAPR